MTLRSWPSLASHKGTCCSVLQCDVVRCNWSNWILLQARRLWCWTAGCRTRAPEAVCYSVLQCVALYCSASNYCMLQSNFWRDTTALIWNRPPTPICSALQYVSLCYAVFHVAGWCRPMAYYGVKMCCCVCCRECCSVLPYIANSVLFCVAGCCGMSSCIVCDVLRCSVFQWVAVRCCALQCVVVYCNVLPCDAVCCSVL